MKVSKAASLSRSNIKRHGLRSLLTSIGMAAGVAVVIAMMTLGSSFEALMVSQYNSSFGLNSFSVGPDGSSTPASVQSPLYAFPRPVFSPADVSGVGKVHGIETVVPYASFNYSIGISLGSSRLAIPFNVQAAEMGGALFQSGYVNLFIGGAGQMPSQAVVGYSVAQSITEGSYGQSNASRAIGMVITLLFKDHTGMNVTVVGVLEPSQSDPAFNDAVILPLPAAASQSARAYDGMLVVADKMSNMQAMRSEVVGYLDLDTAALASAGVGSFTAVTQDGPNAFLQQQVGEYQMIVLAMGFVALLGGAVGMANTMLVSVTERSREIGVMKAVGATRDDIMFVFMIETLIITMAGVAIGLAAGSVIGYWLATFQVLGFSMPLVYNVPWFFITTFIGVGTGMAAGAYPAWRASRVHPAQALKYG